MSAHGFRSVFMVGGIAAAALGCYLVSLRVASERAALESVENRIVLAQRDIRLLNTEIGTRGRLAQLERWNVKVIRLSAPSADQFVENGFQLATLATPERRPAIEAPIVFAAAPKPDRREPVVINDDGSAPEVVRPSRAPADMMHVAGYAKPEPKIAASALKPADRKAVSPKSTDKPATTMAVPVKPKAASAAAPAKAKSPPAVKPVKTATADPLGPLSAPPRKAKSDAGGASEGRAPARAVKAARTTTSATKDPGSRQ